MTGRRPPALRWLAPTLILLSGVGPTAQGGVAAAGRADTPPAEARVAVASNFTGAARRLVSLFEEGSDHRIVLIAGSTGKHYAQIRNGARLDAFLAADIERPRRLEDEGLAVAGSRFTYARGRLVLWSGRAGSVPDGLSGLDRHPFRHLAIAQPELAPYGRAAREALESSGLWDALLPRLVRGESVTQAFQFVASGNAELGLVAYSQAIAAEADAGSWWLVPGSLHSPIDQQAVLLRDRAGPRDFLAFLRSEAAHRVLEDFGYEAP